MKILACGDIHGDQRLAERLAQRAEAENVELVIMCGDLSNDGNDIDNIVGPFVKRNKKVILIPGNHESIATADFLAELYGAVNLHGYSIKHKDIGFFGCGGANVGPVLRLGEEEIFDVLKKAHYGIKDMTKRIMVSHAHPKDSKMEMFSNFVSGSHGIRKAIDEFQPDILLCGHVHEAEGLEEMIGKTRVINVARNGKIIDI